MKFKFKSIKFSHRNKSPAEYFFNIALYSQIKYIRYSRSFHRKPKMKNNQGFSNILVISIAIVLLIVGGYFGLNYYNNLKITSVKTPVEEKYTEFSFVKFKIPSLNQELITKALNETKKLKMRDLVVVTLVRVI